LVTETINQSFPLAAGSRTMSGMLCWQKGVGTHPRNSHFETASNSFRNETWKRCGNAVPTRSRPTTPL